MSNSTLTPDLQKIVETQHHDPFSVLGRHPDGNGGVVVRANIPNCIEVSIAEGPFTMERIPDTDIFEYHGAADSIPERYRLIWRDSGHHEHITHDPYCFPAQIPDFDLHIFNEGKHWHAYKLLGANARVVDNVGGILFAVWAPNAERVSVVGDFNHWDGRAHLMRVRGGSGVWELFIPDIEPGALYKFEIRHRGTGNTMLKTDPYGQSFELRPGTSSIVVNESAYVWRDEAWMKNRAERDWLHTPMSVYEVHLGSWQKGPAGEFLNYRELAERLVSYVVEMGFSHIELLPITEHPLDASWGYQTTGYFAPTSRFGSPDDFRYFVDYCHQHGIGVFLDWVPAHFPKDAHGLAWFDGEPLYEHADPRKGEHLDWSTLIYNYDRHEVKGFLLSSAVFWLQEYHLDGLRVDAVASMLYLDYSREEWIPNKYGGNENLEAMEFLRELNTVVHAEYPGALVMAEESTSWPQVTRPIYVGGLGFSMKWNMGWMNDTLRYVSQDPIYRQYHQDLLTFSMLYAFTENFMLPFSHDEVVHGKGSMLTKMPGDEWQKFANLRVLYTYMFTHPGKKLLFMGTEFGQGYEWDSAGVVDWDVLQYQYHEGLRRLVKDLNRLYHDSSALYLYEFEWQGFDWIDCHDSQQSTLSYLRKSDEETLLVIVNFTPVPRHEYRIGVPFPGKYHEILNSDSEFYGGSNVGNGMLPLESVEEPWMERPHSLVVTVPPLGAIVLKPEYRPPEEEEIQDDETDETEASADEILINKDDNPGEVGAETPTAIPTPRPSSPKTKTGATKTQPGKITTRRTTTKKGATKRVASPKKSPPKSRRSGSGSLEPSSM
uniref:1,4-alpha-glucan branching enzyme GlgB n=1 Tax=Candidatus Kentrum sp. TC TaxID=2126339 RepID=A0A450YED6_9GAMM|nr:MAG: 1,4-alpha-glucan branching enzyme [Candidatus Kentron sp. TC]VFK54195.1 MAG: 1,4-alpha-glucan branching enzyme [Candidatus Kentron sp. TC]